jgi:hypothetical protein
MERYMVRDLLNKLHGVVGEANPYALSVGVEGDRVRLDFSKPVSYVDLTPQQALAVGEALRLFGEQLGKSRG